MGGGHICIAPGCGNVKGKTTAAFFKFPPSKERAKVWCTRCCISYEDLKGTPFLCQDHFGENQFSSKAVTVKRLKSDAIPKQIRLLVPGMPPISEDAVDIEATELKGRKRDPCIAPGCGNVKGQCQAGISFFKFPTCKERAKDWCRRCCIDYEDLKTNSFLCSAHFGEYEFSNAAVKRKRLKPKATPKQIELAIITMPSPNSSTDSKEALTDSIPPKKAKTS